MRIASSFEMLILYWKLARALIRFLHKRMTCLLTGVRGHGEVAVTATSCTKSYRCHHYSFPFSEMAGGPQASQHGRAGVLRAHIAMAVNPASSSKTGNLPSWLPQPFLRIQVDARVLHKSESFASTASSWIPLCLRPSLMGCKSPPAPQLPQAAVTLCSKHTGQALPWFPHFTAETKQQLLISFHFQFLDKNKKIQ